MNLVVVDVCLLGMDDVMSTTIVDVMSTTIVDMCLLGMDDVCLEWRMFAPVYNGMDVVYRFTGFQYWNGVAIGMDVYLYNIVYRFLLL